MSKHPRKNSFDAKLPILILLVLVGSFLAFTNKDVIKKTTEEIIYKDEKLHLLFSGDIFLDRGIDVKSRASSLKYAYPFSGLSTLDRPAYDAWIGNLECPVTEEQSTMYEKENYLKFSCKKEYLPELKKYFDIVSIANNHTDNMNGRKGIEETRIHLKEAGIKYFGDYDNSQSKEACRIVFIKNNGNNLPIALCGFHGVFKLPTEEEIKVIEDYSKYFVTFVMPHQGVEYESRSNTYQKRVYHSFIDHGADAVIGSHPHVMQEVEKYNGKYIFYSLGNFIFDQGWAKTREHFVVDVTLDFPKYKNNYTKLNCANSSDVSADQDCLNKARQLNIVKPEFNLTYKPVFTHADKNFVTTKEELDEKTYNQKLKSILFN